MDDTRHLGNIAEAETEDEDQAPATPPDWEIPPIDYNIWERIDTELTRIGLDGRHQLPWFLLSLKDGSVRGCHGYRYDIDGWLDDLAKVEPYDWEKHEQHKDTPLEQHPLWLKIKEVWELLKEHEMPF